MKKTLLAAALASVALAGCVKNEAEIVQNADSKITFAAPLVSSVTRIQPGEISNPYNDKEHFTVFAKFYSDKYNDWESGDWYIGRDNVGIDVGYNPSLQGWAPSDGKEYYWPKNGTLTFYAYSPSGYETWNPIITASEQMQSVAVNIPNKAANVDLMYSELAKDQDHNNNTLGNNIPKPTPGVVGTPEYYGVELMFKHALSSIHFKVKLSRTYDNATIVLNKIELKEVKSIGNFNWTMVSGVDPVWNPISEPLNYTVVEGIEHNVTMVDTAESIAKAKPIILLPQTLTNVTAEITYTINGREFTSEIKLADLNYGANTNAEWKPGKRYIYTITFSLNTIYFDPTVSDWDNVEVVYPNPSTSAAA